jgi:hypothetical protein
MRNDWKADDTEVFFSVLKSSFISLQSSM